jgi:hypothetical protein
MKTHDDITKIVHVVENDPIKNVGVSMLIMTVRPKRSSHRIYNYKYIEN